MKRTPANRFEQRCDRLLRVCRSSGADAFVVSDPVNVSYLTGFSGDDAYLLVGKAGSVLLTDSRFPEQVEEECPGLT